MKSILLPFSFFAVLLFAIPCKAENVRIRPVLALSSDQSSILASYKEYSEGSVQGAGSKLRISYHSSSPLNGYIAILEGTTYNPANLYHFLLPADAGGTATIDLTALTTWNGSAHSYYLNFLSDADDTDAEFSQMQFLQTTAGDLIGASLQHLMQVEPYWISSAHFLRGYTILGIPFSILLELLTLIVIGIILLRKGTRALAPVLCILIASTFLYALRFDVDLLVYTERHLNEWWRKHTYGEARDLYSVSDALKNDIALHPETSASVNVCFDSTDYYAKLVRYFLYPIPVSITGKQEDKMTHVLVTRKTQWSYDGTILHCGEINQRAKRIQTFNDGSALFSLPSS